MEYTTATCCYLEVMFTDPDKLLRDAENTLKDVEFDTLIGTGVSGIVAVSILGPLMGKRWAVIRKNMSTSHSWNAVEGTVGKKWLLVDDFIDTGATHRRVLKVMTDWSHSYGWSTDYAGSYLYDTGKYCAPGTERTV